MKETLTEYQQRFFAMLEEFPRISVYWDKDGATLQQAKLEQDLLTLSSGERALARFFASLWLGHNAFEFELFQQIQVALRAEGGSHPHHFWSDSKPDFLLTGKMAVSTRPRVLGLETKCPHRANQDFQRSTHSNQS